MRISLVTVLCAAGAWLAVTMLQPPSASAEEIVIDNAELPTTGFIAAPLVAVRPVTTTAGSILFSRTNVTKDLIVRSAAAFPEVEAELSNLNISDPADLSMNDLLRVIMQSGYADRYLYDPDDISSKVGDSPIVTVSTIQQPVSRFWDAKTLTNMVVTGVIDTDNVILSIIDGNQVESFRVNSEYVYPLQSIGVQQAKALRGEFSPAEIEQTFASMRGDVASYDALQQSMLEHVGEITFGVPIIYTTEEKNLHVPESIKRAFDVYWADLVVTYRDINPKDIDELAFNVTVPDESVALKLIPLRFGVDIGHKETTRTPEIGVEYGGAKVSIGEYFSQTVSYTRLKPTIEGYGEGEKAFSWKVKDEAISGGSHRFAAILRVPKGAAEIDFVFSGHVRLRKSWIGEWYDGELIAGTDFWIVPVGLQ